MTAPKKGDARAREYRSWWIVDKSSYRERRDVRLCVERLMATLVRALAASGSDNKKLKSPMRKSLFANVAAVNNFQHKNMTKLLGTFSGDI